MWTTKGSERRPYNTTEYAENTRYRGLQNPWWQRQSERSFPPTGQNEGSTKQRRRFNNNVITSSNNNGTNEVRRDSRTMESATSWHRNTPILLQQVIIQHSSFKKKNPPFSLKTTSQPKFNIARLAKAL